MEKNGTFFDMVLIVQIVFSVIFMFSGIFWCGLEEGYSWWLKEKGHFYKENDSKYGLDDWRRRLISINALIIEKVEFHL